MGINNYTKNSPGTLGTGLSFWLSPLDVSTCLACSIFPWTCLMPHVSTLLLSCHYPSHSKNFIFLPPSLAWHADLPCETLRPLLNYPLSGPMESPMCDGKNPLHLSYLLSNLAPIYELKTGYFLEIFYYEISLFLHKGEGSAKSLFPNLMSYVCT